MMLQWREVKGEKEERKALKESFMLHWKFCKSFA
jgi:hypothetical protein